MQGVLRTLEQTGRLIVLAGWMSLSMAVAAPESGANSTTVVPPTWWTGMHNEQLQLMVRGDNIAHSQVTVDHPSLKIINIASLDSPNYLFIDLDLSEAEPDEFLFTLTKQGVTTGQFTYTLNSRKPGNDRGFDQQETIYLVAPDRFANGDMDNDSIAGLSDKHQPDAPGGRHGGDIQGILNHLDYLQHMGFTQIWSMPLLENAMDSYSYHGYAITDHYRIDPRYGSNSLYRRLSHEAGQRDMGIIMDVVLNHIGSKHPWMDDLPAADWVHHGGEFSPTTHRREALHDIHGVEADKKAFSDGWFVPTMPDLNQQNPFLATFLIQNAIWWVEYAGLSGIRVDTYSYSDKAFLSRWTKALMNQYPQLNIVGEEWTTNPVITSYWQQGSHPADGYQSSLPSVMDFPLQQALVNALTNEESWGSGLIELYGILASDALYGDPYNLVTFTDNQDMSRIFTQLEENYALRDMAMTYLLTSRGIPQIFYGTEVLMANPGTDQHGIIRSDFPGGWPHHQQHAVTGEGLDPQQQKAQNRLRTLLAFRQQHPEAVTGNYLHYVPEAGIYVYFRLDPQGMPVMMGGLNKNADVSELQLERFSPQLSRITQLTRLKRQQDRCCNGRLTVSAGAKCYSMAAAIT
ncbi:cyclomaltodextrinase N-terminal domain-containing protein [Salinimonas marina]|uniref:Cyclomaltodextrinase N-terminal domain-containing protein n=1 Tax=Salinimonas marina TaxID=2785918 RepID=A0A7S9DUT8_9ALTE|nr:glycoside hydrolase family 13 protein [Salinimonas marina]QPG04331.1 cyclomaltodextrinase N-terminal domain-containing protein [Salinimonas marina]